MTFLSRKPYLLYSYLATEMLAPFFASFVIMNAVFFLVKLIPFLNFSLELSIGLADFIRLFCYTFPNMFLYTIPMAAMMGLTIGFSRLSNDTEILALKASGVSMYQILPPVILIAVLISLFTGYFSVRLIPVSEVAMKQLTYQLLKEKVDKGIKEYQFTEALGDLVLHIGEIDQETGEWKNVWVSDMRGQTNPTITMASTGRMRSDIDKMNVTIILRNGSLHRPDNRDSQIVRFAEYTINIPLKPPSEGVTGVHRGTLTMPELVAAADEYGRDTERGRVMLIEFHKRLALPIGCLFLTLLGLPLGLQAGPGKKAIGIPMGLAIFILYYILFTTVKMLAKEWQFPVAISMWLPNILFLAITFFFIRQVTNEQPLIPERVQLVCRRLFDWVSLPFRKAFRYLFLLVLAILPKRAAQPAATPVDLPAKRLAIHGDAKNKVFHLPECDHYNCPNCSIEFKTVAIAIQSGYQPCLFCRTMIDDPEKNLLSH